jgi:hypothetical protein
LAFAALVTAACLVSGCADTEAELADSSESLEVPAADAAQPRVAKHRASSLPSMTSVPAAATDLTVEAAYDKIPHRRTEFDFLDTQIDPVESEYLRLAFRVVEEGTRTRVALLTTLYYGDGARDSSVDDGLRRAKELAEFWSRVDAPQPLASYHRDIQVALEKQARFFREWAEEGNAFAYRGSALGRAPDVRASSQALRRAYDRLMKRYPGESARNRDAFFDYHCALDFL